MLRGPGGFKLASGELMPITAGGFGLFGMGKQRRGELVAAFLAEVAQNPAFPDHIRRAAADPHLIMTDLGGPATYGNDRGFLTDQAAFRTQDIADLINKQMGFGRFAANDNDPASPRMRMRTVGGPRMKAPNRRYLRRRVPRTPPTRRMPHLRRRSRMGTSKMWVAAATRRSAEATTDDFLDAAIRPTPSCMRRSRPRAPMPRR